ncbi:hypothetical protein M0802_016630 [Mischocyttarus mexicanus]|nr:hypothetical protein M0802_016630 [Mischocyttarus mexicanus]
MTAKKKKGNGDRYSVGDERDGNPADEQSCGEEYGEKKGERGKSIKIYITLDVGRKRNADWPTGISDFDRPTGLPAPTELKSFIF